MKNKGKFGNRQKSPAHDKTNKSVLTVTCSNTKHRCTGKTMSKMQQETSIIRAEICPSVKSKSRYFQTFQSSSINSNVHGNRHYNSAQTHLLGPFVQFTSPPTPGSVTHNGIYPCQSTCSIINSINIHSNQHATDSQNSCAQYTANHTAVQHRKKVKMKSKLAEIPSIKWMSQDSNIQGIQTELKSLKTKKDWLWQCSPAIERYVQRPHCRYQWCLQHQLYDETLTNMPRQTSWSNKKTGGVKSSRLHLSLTQIPPLTCSTISNSGFSFWSML